MARTNSAWVLKRRPIAAVASGDLELVDLPVPRLGADQVLIRNVYLSLDPTNRLWMSGREQYMKPVEAGDVMRGITIGVVEESTSDRYAPGEVVMPVNGGWQQYVVADARTTSRVRRRDGVPLTAHLSVLGMTGITAYYGLTDICRPQPGETLVVSAAAGAVGSVVGQIAKIQGCRVVGIAGGPGKCRWIVDELGFDGAVDYKSEDVGAALDRLCPDGIDMSFENVGGTIMEATFTRLNTYGRMALCGMISGYNDEGPLSGPTDFGRVLMRRLTVRGFVVIDNLPRAREALENLGGWVAEGRIRWEDHVVDGLEQASDALGRLFRGDHDGKLIVQVAEEAAP